MLDKDSAELIVDLVKEFLNPVLSGLKNISKKKYDQLSIDMNFAFKKYLERSYEKNSKTKTLLYRDTPVNLKQFYVRTDLIVGSSRVKNSVIDEKSFVKSILSKRRLIIEGSAGTGKSTFGKSIFIELVESQNDLLPIFLELRLLNNQSGMSLFDFIFKSISDVEHRITQEMLNYAILHGRILFIFDGFDEIHSEYREKYEKEIIELSSNNHNIRCIVSSRVDPRFSSWHEFQQYRMLPLDKSKALQLISKLDYDTQIKDAFILELDNSLFDKHQSFAQNPLLLTMMLLTYEQIAEIPTKIHLFYEQAFQTLFNKHDSLKSLYKRKSFSALPLDDFKKTLSAFCVLSYSDRKYSFTEKDVLTYIGNANKITNINVSPKLVFADLLDSVCLIQRDGLGYTFTHRSFQEYFTALFLVNYSAQNSFEVIDKIAYLNDRDNVIPMIHDMNSDFLENQWVIPKLEKTISKYNFETASKIDLIKNIAIMYEGLSLHIYNENEERSENEMLRYSISYRHKTSADSDANLRFVLMQIYDINSYFIKYKRSNDEDREYKDELISLIKSSKDELISLQDIDSISEHVLELIINCKCHMFVKTQIDTFSDLLSDLKCKQKNKQSDLLSMLLNS